jgi:Tfp pilus assembly PilM family ATPase
MPLKLPGRERPKKVPPEITGVDLGATGVKMVRIRNNKGALSVVGVGVQPPMEWPPEPAGHAIRFKPPKEFLTNYAVFTIPGRAAVIRLLTMSGHAGPEDLTDAKIREQMGCAEDFRISHAVLPAIKGRSETRVLGVGIPEKDIKIVLSFVPAGPPAAYSIELAGLATLTAFERGAGADSPYDGIAVIDAGQQTTLMALYVRKNLVLIRKFDFGGETVLAKVQQQLGVDRETAVGIIADGSFDISQPVHEVMDPFLRQLTISKDFVERREECTVGAVYLSGGVTLARYWVDELHASTGLDIVAWNPFEKLEMLSNALPQELAGQETRFAAAVGAAIGIYEV